MAQIEPYTIMNQTPLQTATGVPYLVIIQQNTRGMVLKEFVYQGLVFAQLWFGSALPNLNIVLGDQYYARYEQALNHSNRTSHRQLQLIDNEFTLTNYGRMGDFWGTSYLSNRFPSGFSINNIQ